MSVTVVDQLRASPRARNLAARKSIDLNGLHGSGPGGRIIERDVQAALQTAARLTPVAQIMVAAGDFTPPERGTGAGGRITKRDLIPAQTQPEATPSTEAVEIIPLKGARKVIAARMLESLQTTAQLTLNASADARALLDYRKRLKNSAPELGLQKVTINDLVLFAVSRTLTQFSDLNSLFQDNAIHRYQAVHLGMAVDTQRGLLVPVIRRAQILSLKMLADEAHRLAEACTGGQIKPDELTGGTFSVSNLGNLGIESFTPVLNPPQVGILGVGGINLKPVEVDGKVTFIPHLSLSLTINHQVVDGAPGARFLQALSRNLGQIDVLVSV
jgi:pyruvate dehydrogenase E2 component (dihydrolipoamide acetyltransferase)